MRRLMILPAFGALLLNAIPAAAQEDGVTLRTAAQIRAMITATKNGIASVHLPMASEVIATRRERTGTPELHKAINDVFVGQAGTAVLLVGGRLEGAHETSPGEWREGTIVGGRRVGFAAGDVVLIPAGVPHQMLLEQGAFDYLAFKTPAAK